jgi:GNAT superfamily N-acetyltransferase
MFLSYKNDCFSDSSSATKTVSKPCLSLRRMEKKDLEMVMIWCKEEGWNVGKYDAHFYYLLDSTGHFLFLLDNQPVGAISVIQYSSQFLAIGPFIVKKEYRNKGYGTQIWHHAMELLEKNSGATSVLYSVPAQISRYEKSGFKQDYYNQRWQKKLTANIDSDSVEVKEAEGIKYLDSNMLESVINYDQIIFSVSREKLLSMMIKSQNVTGFVSTGDKGEITGFGLVRPCIEGYRVGPLYADTIKNAQDLFSFLLKTVDNSTVFIDAPTSNPYLESFAQYFNLDRVSEADTVAMFKGEVPRSLRENSHKNYAIYSLEIG